MAEALRIPPERRSDVAPGYSVRDELRLRKLCSLRRQAGRRGPENPPVTDRVGESAVLVDPIHLRQSLSPSLLGPVEANLYVFRANAENTGIDQTFTAAILTEQYPIVSHDLEFALTMTDIFGNSAIPGFIDPQESITFSLENIAREDTRGWRTRWHGIVRGPKRRRELTAYGGKAILS